MKRILLVAIIAGSFAGQAAITNAEAGRLTNALVKVKRDVGALGKAAVLATRCALKGKRGIIC
jgi:hypothetical protein